jgi:hypothetical protein
MSENLALARPYLLMLAIFTTGRLLQGADGVPYEKGHHIFSIVILTLHTVLYYGAFTRRWRRFALLQAVGLGATLGVISQLVILTATVLSYALGMHTYFNDPTALNAPGPLALAQALPVRLGGLVGNSILAGVAGALGWTLGGLLPAEPAGTPGR